MLRQRLREAGEAAGILSPSIHDARSAAEQRRADMVAAHAAVIAAEEDLNGLYDRCSEPRVIQAAEAKLAAAKISADRAQRAYASAEKRLAAALDAEAAKKRAEMIVRRDAALGVRGDAAAEIDRLALVLAAQVRLYDEQAVVLSEAAAVGVASRNFHFGGHDLARQALERAGALPSRWIGDRAEQPGAVEMAARDAGAVVASVS